MVLQTQQNVHKLKKLLISKCLKDPEFKQKFLADPRGAIEQEFKIELPEELTIKALEDQDTVLHVVLPSSTASTNVQEFEMSDEELSSVTGGAISFGKGGTEADQETVDILKSLGIPTTKIKIVPKP